jgi:hypothetical protein
VATRTHCARIATLLRWQNISLCALLISRPTYIAYLVYSFFYWLNIIKWKGIHKCWRYQSWYILRLYFSICLDGLRNHLTPWNCSSSCKKKNSSFWASQIFPHIFWNLKVLLCADKSLPDAACPYLHMLKEFLKISFCVAGLWAGRIKLGPPKQRIKVFGKWPTWCTNSFLCVYFYLQLSTCFEHTVLIIRRGKLYKYSFW